MTRILYLSMSNEKYSANYFPFLRRYAAEVAALPVRTRWIAPREADPDYENLYDRFYCVRGDSVEDVWPIMERASGPPYF